MKFCKDCKYFSQYSKAEAARCTHPNVSREERQTSPVHGETVYVLNPFCRVQRDGNSWEPSRCGPNGRYFEKRSWFSG